MNDNYRYHFAQSSDNFQFIPPNWYPPGFEYYNQNNFNQYPNQHGLTTHNTHNLYGQFLETLPPQNEAFFHNNPPNNYTSQYYCHQPQVPATVPPTGGTQQQRRRGGGFQEKNKYNYQPQQQAQRQQWKRRQNQNQQYHYTPAGPAVSQQSPVAASPSNSSNSSQFRRNRTMSNCSSASSTKNPEYLKTKICDHWRANGSCSYGVSCWYAHGEDDLRKTMDQYSLSNSSSSRNSNPSPIARMMSDDKENGQQQQQQQQTAKMMKNEDGALKNKRSSTNVKGLTVNIPLNIATNEDNSPLSPAQERWVSMSSSNSADKLAATPSPTIDKPEPIVGSTPAAPSASASASSSTSASSATITGGSVSTITLGDGGGETTEMTEKEGEAGESQGAPPQTPALLALRNEEMSQAALENMDVTRFFANPMLHRSINRGAQPRLNVVTHFGTGEQQQQQNAKLSRSTSNFGYSSFGGAASAHEQTIATVPENVAAQQQQQQQQQYNRMRAFNNAAPAYYYQQHQQQPSSNLIDEICRRRKIIESGGHLDTMNTQSNVPTNFPKINEFQQQQQQPTMQELQHLQRQSFLNEQARRRILQQQQQQQQEAAAAAYRHSEMERARSMMMGGGRSAAGGARLVNNTTTTSTDCHCGSKVKMSLYHHSMQHPQILQQHHQHQLHHQIPLLIQQQQQQQHLQQLSQQQQQMHQQFGGGAAEMPIAPLAPPPKISQTLMPNDDSFSIWLDTKPQQQQQAQQVPKVEDFGIGPNMFAELRSGEQQIGEKERGESPLTVRSLYELLSSENLIEKDEEEEKKIKKQKEDIFSFDLLKFETDKLSTEKENVELFVVAEKTPNIVVTPPASAAPKKAEKMGEKCHFFSIGGWCPFGDACSQQHSTDEEN